MVRRTRVAALLTLAMINVVTLAAGIAVARMLPPRLAALKVPTVATDGPLAGTDPVLGSGGSGGSGGTGGAGTQAGPLSTNVASNVTGSFGKLNIAADGSYVYTVDNANTTVQALRTFAQTLTDTFSYTMHDAANATSTAQVTVTIHGQNDAPVANADTATATEAGGTNNGTAGTNISNFNVLTGVGAGSVEGCPASPTRRRSRGWTWRPA